MGIAAIIIGIISAILAFIPVCGVIAFLPAVVGIILGIVDVVQKGKKQLPKGIGIAGIILNVVAILIIAGWLIFIRANADTIGERMKTAVEQVQKQAEQAQKQAEQAAEEVPTENVSTN